jgi:hypothetical protein
MPRLWFASGVQATDELARVDPQTLGDLYNVAEAEIALPPLDLADICPVQTTGLG